MESWRNIENDGVDIEVSFNGIMVAIAKFPVEEIGILIRGEFVDFVRSVIMEDFYVKRIGTFNRLYRFFRIF